MFSSLKAGLRAQRVSPLLKKTNMFSNSAARSFSVSNYLALYSFCEY